MPAHFAPPGGKEREVAQPRTKPLILVPATGDDLRRRNGRAHTLGERVSLTLSEANAVCHLGTYPGRRFEGASRLRAHLVRLRRSGARYSGSALGHFVRWSVKNGPTWSHARNLLWCGHLPARTFSLDFADALWATKTRQTVQRDALGEPTRHVAEIDFQRDGWPPGSGGSSPCAPMSGSVASRRASGRARTCRSTVDGHLLELDQEPGASLVDTAENRLAIAACIDTHGDDRARTGGGTDAIDRGNDVLDVGLHSPVSPDRRRAPTIVPARRMAVLFRSSD